VVTLVSEERIASTFTVEISLDGDVRRFCRRTAVSGNGETLKRATPKEICSYNGPLKQKNELRTWLKRLERPKLHLGEE
jgi:hypothetical protein